MFKSHAIRIALWSVAALAVIAVLYVVWWQVLASKWQEGIAGWEATVAKQGWTVTTGDLSVSGFPGVLRIGLPAPKAQGAAGNSWTGPTAVLEISPFAPLTPRFSAPGHHIFTLAGHAPVDIDAENLTGTVTAARGGPSAISIDARRVSTGAIALDGFTAEIHRLDAKSDDPTAPVLAATAEIDRLGLPENALPVLDRTVSVAHLALRLRGTIPPGPPAQSLATWRDAGGTIEIDSLDLDWPPLAGAGNATLALDKDLQPELAGSVTVRGLPALIDRMVQLGEMKPGAAVAAKVVLGLAATENTDGMPENKVGVAIQNRVLSVGPARIVQLPEVAW